MRLTAGPLLIALFLLCSNVGGYPSRYKPVHAGTLYGEAKAGDPAFNQRVAFGFGVGTGQIATNYHQKRCDTHGGKASSDMKCSEIPAGFLIETSGTTAWAVFKPQFTQGPGGGNFSMQLYCGPEAAGGQGCNVRVKVSYMLRTGP